MNQKPCLALMAYRGEYTPGKAVIFLAAKEEEIEAEAILEDLTEIRKPPVEGKHEFVCQRPGCGKVFRRAVSYRKYCSNSCSVTMRWALTPGRS